jgi:hypothetical protein
MLTVGAAIGAKTLGKIVAGSAGSIAIGLIGGFAGIWLGLRKQLKEAIDDEERRGLTRSAGINALTTVAFVVAMLLVVRFDSGWVWPLIAGLAFMASIFYQTMVVQPRVTARRRALETQRDPVRAAARRRRERIQCWVGAIIGFVFGFGGLIAGLIMSGKI